MNLKKHQAKVRRIQFAVCIVALLPSPLSAQISIGPNVKVSAARPNRAHFEIQLATDPENAKHLLACSMIASPQKADYNVVTYASFNGGKTWQATLEIDNGSPVGDPSCTYGPHGTAYSVALGRKINQNYRFQNVMWVYRSKDGGKSWSSPLELPFIDREYLVADHTGKGYEGRLYLHGFEKSLLKLFQSSDLGTSFRQSASVTLPVSANFCCMGNSVVLSDGTLVTLFGQYGESQRSSNGSERATLKVAMSPDGGEHYETPVRVSDVITPGPRASTYIPSLAVDQSHSPFRDRLYAVWPDQRSGRVEAMLSYSSDKGMSWSEPIVINDDKARPSPQQGPDHVLPVVAVNSSGVVGVAWYDRRDSPDNLGTWLRFASSLDGGETFLPSVKVSKAPFTYSESDLHLDARVRGGGNRWQLNGTGPLNISLLSTFYYDMGHTGGMATDNEGIFHPLWVDNRTGVSQLWTATITVSGRGVPNGSLELAARQDLTDKVTLDISYPKFNYKAGIVTLDAYLANTSPQTITGPIAVRLLSLNAPFGEVSVVNADNGLLGPGAVWDFSGSLDRGMLKPGERSRSKNIQLRLVNLPAIRPARGPGANSWINLRVKVLGTIGAGR